MEEFEETIEILIQPNHIDTKMIEVFEMEKSYVLRCSHPGRIQRCRAQLPDRKNEMLIMDGFMASEFSAYDTK